MAGPVRIALSRDTGTAEQHSPAQRRSCPHLQPGRALVQRSNVHGLDFSLLEFCLNFLSTECITLLAEKLT